MGSVDAFGRTSVRYSAAALPVPVPPGLWSFRGEKRGGKVDEAAVLALVGEKNIAGRLFCLEMSTKDTPILYSDIHGASFGSCCSPAE